MKNKFILLLVSVMLTLCLVACGNTSDATTDAEPATEAEQQAEEEPAAAADVAVRDLPEGEYEEKGDGEAYISTAGGTSEDGNVPVIYIDTPNMVMQIGLNSRGFNGASLSYVYVDGVEIATEQLADTQTSLTLESSQLSEGVHVVEVVQYANDDTTAEMVTYRSMSYEVKMK